ncbi:MAG TPA: DUF167 domain-containing protein [Chthoniobacterales bacterium]
MLRSEAKAQGFPIRVVPGAKRNAVEVTADGTVKIRLQARAVDGKANAALKDFLADVLGVSPNAVVIRAGEHSRNKIIQVEGVSRETVHARLAPT